MAGRRRVVGVGGVQRRREEEAKFKQKGSELASDQLASLSQQLQSFSGRLEEFAGKHREEIRRNGQFRRHFQEMCASVGVDPLASSKGFWADKLGVGLFYYELAVQIVEVCLSTNHLNGGIMTLDELRQRLARSRSRTKKEILSNDDLIRAVEKIKVLGGGFQLVPMGGGRYLVQSVPGELNMDHTRLLQLAEDTGFVTKTMLMERLHWDEERADASLSHVVREAIAWVDRADGEGQYWIPSLFMQQYNSSTNNSSTSYSGGTTTDQSTS